MVTKKRLGTPKPKLTEISFSGNMPPQYEKNLRKDLAKSKTTIKLKKK